MTWTSEKPTVAGWYWMRAPKHGWRDCVMWVEKDEDGFYIDVGDCDSEYVADIEAEWLGPITPDSYQQGRVAGLREAEKYALRCLKELQDKIRDLESGKCVLAGAQTKEGVEAWVHAKTLEASRIAKWITARIIEQQAQEGGVGDANIKMS